MRFYNTRKKFRELWDRSLKLENETEILEKIKGIMVHVTANKRIYKLPLLENYRANGGFYFEYDLDKFPEWILPYLKLVPILHIEDGWLSEYKNTQEDDIDWSFWIEHYFLKIEDNHYKLVGLGSGELRLDSQEVPVYIDLDLYLTNERQLHEIQSTKT